MIRIGLLDSVIAVEADDAVLVELAGLFPLVGADAPATGRVEVSHGTCRSSLQTLSAPDPASAVLVVAALVNELAVHQCRSFAVHAAVVARAGRVVALAAESGTGKSTLCAVLLTRGWEYVSDEALVLDADGSVRPYPRPLALSPWSLRYLGLPEPAAGADERLVCPAELSAQTASGRLSLTDVVQLERSSPSRLSATTGAAGAAVLLRYAFNHYRAPRSALLTVARPGVKGWGLLMADPDDAAQLLEVGLV